MTGRFWPCAESYFFVSFRNKTLIASFPLGMHSTSPLWLKIPPDSGYKLIHIYFSFHYSTT